MARGNTAGHALTSASWTTIFDTATDGPAKSFLVQNAYGPWPALFFLVTGNDGYTTTGFVEPGQSTLLTPGASGISTVQLKSEGKDMIGYGYPVSWNNP